MPTDDWSETVRERSGRLFKFLKGLAQLRTPPVMSVDDYEQVIWFSELPEQQGIFSVFRELEQDRDSLWLEVETPHRKHVPEPPASVAPFLSAINVSDSSRDLPPLCAAVDADGNQTKPGDFVQSIWNDYLVNEWCPWADEDKRLASLGQLAQQLHEIKLTLKNLAEQYELLLGIGLLHWRNQNSKELKRHLLTIRATLTFDSKRGIYRISCADDDAAWVYESDMLDLDEQPQDADRESFFEQLNGLEEVIWDQQKLDQLFATWLNSVSSRGKYHNTEKPPEHAAGETPEIILAPAIFLRKRADLGYVRVCDKIVEQVEIAKSIPPGVQRLVEVMDDAGFALAENDNSDEIYFPLPSNPEQSEIAEKLKSRQGILVQGPPGTGKSHTITNLICHLLAQGKRILVTSHTPRALRVLRDKFPAELRPLCISVVGDDAAATRESLEESIAIIDNRYATWGDGKKSAKEVDALVEKLKSERSQTRALMSKLKELRDWDVRRIEGLQDHYSGTPQEIARQLARETPDFEWIDNPSDLGAAPLTNEEASELLELCKQLPQEVIRGLRMHALQPGELPAPDLYSQKLIRENELKQRISGIERARKEHPSYAASAKLSKSARAEISNKIHEIIVAYTRLKNRKEKWVDQATSEILSDHDRSWRELDTLTRRILESVGEKHKLVAETQVGGVEELDPLMLKAQAEDLLAHLRSGKGLGFAIFAAKPVRQGQHLLKRVRVNGRLCDNESALTLLIDFLDVQERVKTLRNHWREYAPSTETTLLSSVSKFLDYCEPLEAALKLYDSLQSIKLDLASKNLIEPDWSNLDDLILFRDVLVEGELEKEWQSLQDEHQALLNRALEASAHANSHPALARLCDALESRDEDGYKTSFQQLKDFDGTKQGLTRRDLLLKKLSNALPQLADSLVDSAQDPVWRRRLAKFEAAWRWSQACIWLRSIADPKAQQVLCDNLEEQSARTRKLLGEIGVEKAWEHFFQRLSEPQRQALKAWSKAVKRIGKGKGKYAEEHRKQARQHMLLCRTAIPAWIMPVHKVIESLEPQAELFDVIIVDEASQSGPEALLLMYLAKQIIVVGDDKQISPDFVGLNRESVNALRNQYIKDVPFCDAIGLDHSLFEIAEIRFGGKIRLREHFRCMPEIIEFSNRLCYSEEPLVPLRQFGSSRLQPVIRTVPVQTKPQEEDDDLTVNEAEAEAIVETVTRLCRDKQYTGKSMGVISLLNTSKQAKYIRGRLESMLGPEEMTARKIVCGDAYEFQGDERDIIFLSMVARPKPTGRILQPLARSADERRFNVAASRARDQLWLFHSVPLQMLSEKCIRQKLLSYCQSPRTLHAKQAVVELASVNTNLQNPPDPFERWLEFDVFKELSLRGFGVLPKTTVGSYSVDLLIEGINGHVALFCDGDEQLTAEQFDETVQVQQDLVRCGTPVLRLRGSIFYLDKDRALAELVDTLRQLAL